jgi:hypothetical protein
VVVGGEVSLEIGRRNNVGDVRLARGWKEGYAVDAVCCVDGHVAVEVMTLAGVAGTGRLAGVAVAIESSAPSRNWAVY